MSTSLVNGEIKMNNATLEVITEEFRSFLRGSFLREIFQVSSFSFVFDFSLPDELCLFVSVDSFLPRIYLIRRNLRRLEKITPSNFLLFLRKRVVGGVLEEVLKLPNERVLKFFLIANDELEMARSYFLIVQLTGRSANLFLTDENEFILACLKENEGEGQTVGSRFLPPKGAGSVTQKGEVFDKGSFETFSEALDKYYSELVFEKLFQDKARKAKRKIEKGLAKCKVKEEKLAEELKKAENAFLWKKYGDLILANLNNAIRLGNKVLLVDYFDENLPTLEIEIEEKLSLIEAAEKFFKKYSKAKRATEEIKNQMKKLSVEAAKLELLKNRIDEAIEKKDEEFLDEFLESTGRKSLQERRKEKELVYARRFWSSDGLEILVGNGARENDYLTFRIAKSLDFWFHAADYPGSHVIVRNPNRLETLPQNTLLEAAQIAAFYSQARKHPKAAVNYTQRKFVNKPKSAPPGLVSLSRFKTILVEPKMTFNKT